MKRFRRPSSLAEALMWSDSREQLSFHLRDFLDEFYADPRPERIAEEPSIRSVALSDGGFSDAYVAGVADHLARINRFPIPSWVHGPLRSLRDPWFAMESHGGRMLLLVESPAAFRERNIFITADALSRA